MKSNNLIARGDRQSGVFRITTATPVALALIAFWGLASHGTVAAMTDVERAFLANQEQMQREFATLQMQAQVLEQRARVKELERKIQGEAAAPASPPGGLGAVPIDLRGMLAGIPAGGLPGMLGGPLPAQAPQEPGMRLLGVHGFQGRVSADVQVGDTRVRATVGDVLGDDWTIREITPSRVTLTRDRPTRQTWHLGFQ